MAAQVGPRQVPSPSAPLDDSVEELYEHAPCGYLSTTLDGTVVKANETLLSWTGYGRGQLVAVRRFEDLLAPGARVLYLTHHVPQLERLGTIRGVSLDLQRSDGSTLPVLVHSVMTPGSDAAPPLIRTTVFDATERRAYEGALLAAREQAERSARRLAVLHQVASACASALTTHAVAESVTAAAARGLAARGCAMWLLDAERTELSRVAAVDVPDVLAPPRISVDGPQPAAVAWRRGAVSVLGAATAHAEPVLAEALSGAGVDVVVSVPLRLEERILGVLGLFLRRAEPLDADDLALFTTVGSQVGQALELARLHEDLEHQALHDPLTGLPNRALLHDRLALALSRAGRTGRTLTVLAVDLDGFKKVNDRCGHAEGDALLVEVAHRLRAVARPSDTVARLGGDEFVVVCEDADEGTAVELAHRVERALVLDVPTDRGPLRVTASVGTAVHSSGLGSGDLVGLLDQADRAMYQAKWASRTPRD